MFANLNPGHLGIRTDFAGRIDLARRHGFTGIDVPVGGLLEDDPDVGRRMLADAGLRPGGCDLPVEFRKDDAAYRDSAEGFEHYCQTAERLGVTRCVTWLMPCHDELPYRENFELHVDRLRPLAATLAEHGLRFGIEFVGPVTLRRTRKYEFVHTIDQALELADAIGSDTGLLLDSWHWYTSHATTDDIRTKLPGRVVYVHVNDAPPDVPVDEQLDNVRRLPCTTGVIDAAAFMQALDAIGYDGPVTAEPFDDSLKALPPDEAAAKTGEAVHKILALA